MQQKTIHLTKHEIQSGLNRQKSAEGLILQLPKEHEGRNTWILNYGVGEEAIALRKKHNKNFLQDKQAAEGQNEQLIKQSSKMQKFMEHNWKLKIVAGERLTPSGQQVLTLKDYQLSDRCRYRFKDGSVRTLKDDDGKTAPDFKPIWDLQS